MRLSALPPLLLILITNLIAQGSGFSRDDHAAAAAPRGIALADFNRDGWIDIATAGTAGASVAVLLNQAPPRSSFRAGQAIPVGGGPFDIAAGDLNRDGIPDLAIANADLNAVTVLIGRGNGAFQPKRDVAMAGNPRGIALADVDQDGKLDILVTQYVSGSWRILFGDGSGRIARSTTVATGALPQGIAAADLNHDGRLDVVVAHASSSGLIAFYGSASGSWTRRSVGDGASNVLVTRDFNRDGWIDVAAASTTRSIVTVYLGAASGFRAPASYQTGPSPRGIDAADLNRDGFIDFVTANRGSSTVSVLLGRASPPGTFASAREVAAGLGARDVAIGDLDRDGRSDLASVNEQGNSSTVLLNTEVFTLSGSVLSISEPLGPRGGFGSTQALAMADFDHSGRPDVAVIAREGVIVLLNGTRRVNLGGGSPSALATADFNNDGNADILAPGTLTGDLRVYLGDGRGGFTLRDRVAAPLVHDVLVADLNRDGRMDVIAHYFDVDANTTFLRTLRGRGDGTFMQSTERTLVAPATSMATGDLNRDGIPDLVVGQFMTPGFTVLLGNGSGGWSSVRRTPLDAGVAGVALGDFTEDGVLDLVTSAFGEEVTLFAGRSDGTYAAGRTHLADVDPLGPFVSSLGVGDVNLDGHADIVTRGGDVLLGQGDGTFELFSFEFFGDHPTVADYNLDGLPDLLFTLTDWFGVLLNRRSDQNRPPVASAGSDVTINYAFQSFEDYLSAGFSRDPDVHQLTYEWRDENGMQLSTAIDINPVLLPGRHTLTLTVSDGRGGRASDTVVVTVTPFKEIVMPASMFEPHGAWRLVDDETAVTGLRMHHPDAGAAKLQTPLASPANYIELSFPADPTQTYKLWIRGKADRDHWSNDSVFVQFLDATDTARRVVYQIGSTSALAVNLEECSNCGLSSWGWEDDGWGAVNRNGAARLRFPDGNGTIRIQTREDGFSIDQIVLSSERYLTRRPGSAKNDRTILEVTIPQ